MSVLSHRITQNRVYSKLSVLLHTKPGVQYRGMWRTSGNIARPYSVTYYMIIWENVLGEYLTLAYAISCRVKLFLWIFSPKCLPIVINIKLWDLRPCYKHQLDAVLNQLSHQQTPGVCVITAGVLLLHHFWPSRPLSVQYSRREIEASLRTTVQYHWRQYVAKCLSTLLYPK